MYEIYNMYCHVLDPVVPFLIEVFCNFIIILLFSEVEMLLETFHELAFRLSDVLFATSFAC